MKLVINHELQCNNIQLFIKHKTPTLSYSALPYSVILMRISYITFITTLMLSSYSITSNASANTCSTTYDMKFVRSQIQKIKGTAGELSPSAMQHVHTEGLLPGQGIHDQSIQAEKDLKLMQVSAVAWKNGMGEEWLGTAKKYLFAWVGTYQPNFNPIDETAFDQMIQTYSIVKPKLSEEERRNINKYFYDWASEYISQMNNAPNKSTWTNNWQSHRVKLITLMAVATRNDHLFAESRRLFQEQINVNIDSDGETLDFKQRDAIHYVVYDLQPLVQAALAAQKMGEDWYHWTAPDGASLAKAVSWLTPYVNGEQTHNEFVNSRVKFDAVRKQDGIKGFNGLFRPEMAKELYWGASAFESTLMPLAQKLSPTPPLFMDWCN